MVLDTEPWNSHVENIVDPAINGVLFLTQFEGDTHNYLGQVIPMLESHDFCKPWWGVCHWLRVSLCCSSTFGVREADRLATWAVVVGFDCPMPWVTMNKPLAQALCAPAVAAAMVFTPA